jgi:hypothetical protein
MIQPLDLEDLILARIAFCPVCGSAGATVEDVQVDGDLRGPGPSRVITLAECGACGVRWAHVVDIQADEGARA